MSSEDNEDWLKLDPYGMTSIEKSKFLFHKLIKLTESHSRKCERYKYFLQLVSDSTNYNAISDIPFLSVRAFKEFDLMSIEDSAIFKTMTSSGTSGQAVSKIYLDRHTARLQSKVLSNLMKTITGSKRLPMLIIDSPNVIKDRENFSARGAGILGFSMFGSKVKYALNDKMEINLAGIKDFVKENNNVPILIFGFTFIIWQYFLLPLIKSETKLELENGILLHGGGWKKLADKAIENKDFKEYLQNFTKIKNVFNYYGLVEQTGSLFFECKEGYLHASIYSDIIIRRPEDFGVSKNGEIGVIQVLSCLPQSYPGHSLLTDDLGIVHGEDNCSCGMMGKYFSVVGRLPKVEVRGCSDTFETNK